LKTNKLDFSEQTQNFNLYSNFFFLLKALSNPDLDKPELKRKMMSPTGRLIRANPEPLRYGVNPYGQAKINEFRF